jgi:hypothetical protein
MADPLNFLPSFQTESTLASGIQWAQSNSQSLKKTRLGLSVITLSIVIMLICIIGMCFGLMLLMGTKGFDEEGIKVTITVLRILVVSLVYVVGPICCLAVPAESGARGFLAGSIVLNLISIATSIVHDLAPMTYPNVFFNVSGICGFVGFIMFIVFMQKLSEYIGRYDLVTRSKTLLIVYIILVVILMCTFAMPLMFLAAAIVGIIFFIMYFYLVDDLRKALGKVAKPETA